jgi:hypothetical protein
MPDPHKLLPFPSRLDKDLAGWAPLGTELHKLHDFCGVCMIGGFSLVQSAIHHQVAGAGLDFLVHLDLDLCMAFVA